MQISKKQLEIEEKLKWPSQMTRTNLATAYVDAGRFAEADELYKQLLASGEKEHGTNSPELIPVLMFMGQLYQSTGRLNDATLVFTRAEKLQDDSHAPADAITEDLKYDIGSLLKTQGKYLQAEKYVSKSLAEKEKIHGANDNSIASTCTLLASIEASLGKYTEAEKLYKRALDIDTKAQPANFANVYYDKFGLALLNVALGKVAEADELFRSAFEGVLKKNVSADEATFGDGERLLAIIDQKEGKTQEARKLIEHALFVHERYYGDKNPVVAEDLAVKSTICESTGNKIEAEQLIKRAISTAESSLGKNHPKVGKYLTQYAEQLRRAHNDSAAKQLEIRAEKIKKESLRPVD